MFRYTAIQRHTILQVNCGRTCSLRKWYHSKTAHFRPSDYIRVGQLVNTFLYFILKLPLHLFQTILLLHAFSAFDDDSTHKLKLL